MNAAFPLDLARVSRGWVLASAPLRLDPAPLLATVSEALSATFSIAVEVRARAMPAPGEPVLGAARVLIPCPTAGGDVVVEVEARLLARLVAQVTGRSGAPAVALAASDAEQAVLALCALVAADVARAGELGTLQPLVALGDPPRRPPDGALAIQLSIRAGDATGWGRVLVAPAVIRALADPAVLSGPAARLTFRASLRDGSIPLCPDELAALAPGDVLLLDRAPGPVDLVVPGGLTFRGRLASGVHHISELCMTEAQSAYPLLLSVEIARVRLTLAELSRLAPGVALPLDVRKDGAVVLRAGEDAIARGTLVEIDGGLGVRLAQVGPLP